MKTISGFPENAWNWTNNVCTNASMTITGNFALSAVVFAKVGGTPEATLETEGGRKFKCTGVGGRGEIYGAKNIGKIVVAYTGCEEPATKVKCNTLGANAGEIGTARLLGEIGYIHTLEERHTNSSLKEVGTDLWPESRTAAEITNHEFKATFSEFECTGAEKYKVRGGLIGEITPINTAVSGLTGHFTLTYKQKEGAQLTKRLPEVEAGAENVLEISRNGGAFEKFGVLITTEAIPVEAEEIKG